MCTGTNSTTEKRAYTVEEVASMLEIGMTSAYKLVHSGELKIRRVGRSIRISKESFDAWLDKHDQE